MFSRIRKFFKSPKHLDKRRRPPPPSRYDAEPQVREVKALSGPGKNDWGGKTDSGDAGIPLFKIEQLFVVPPQKWKAKSVDARLQENRCLVIHCSGNQESEAMMKDMLDGPSGYGYFTSVLKLSADQAIIHPTKPRALLRERLMVVGTMVSSTPIHRLTYLSLDTFTILHSSANTLIPRTYVNESIIILEDMKNPSTIVLWDADAMDDPSQATRITLPEPIDHGAKYGGTRDAGWLFMNYIKSSDLAPDLYVYSTGARSFAPAIENVDAACMTKLTFGDEERCFVLWGTLVHSSRAPKLCIAEPSILRTKVVVGNVREVILPIDERLGDLAIKEILVPEALGIAYVISRDGWIYLVDIESATMIHTQRIPLIANANVLNMSENGVDVFACRAGQSSMTGPSMFSNFRKRLEDSLDAVEQLASQQMHPRNNSLDHSSPPTSSFPPERHRSERQSSQDSLNSRTAAGGTAGTPSQLAESALSSIRKSLASQRVQNPSGSVDNEVGAARRQGREDSPGRDASPSMKRTNSGLRSSGRGMTLEDRLKAKLMATSDASASNRPSSSAPPTPPPPEPASESPPPANPVDIPLPSSPIAVSEPEVITSPSLDNAVLAISNPTQEDPLRSPSPPTPPPAEPLVSTDNISSPPPPAVDPTVEAPPPPPAEPPPEDAPVPVTTPDNDTPAVDIGSPVLEPSEPVVRKSVDSIAGPSGTSTPPTLALNPNQTELDAEKLKERLKLVEQRFSDVSKSFKRIQAEKVAVERVLKEFTPLEGISDAEGLREHLRNINLKAEMSTEEIKRLNSLIQRHDERLEELRDTHRLESKSQSESIELMRKRLHEAEVLLTASSETTSSIEAASSAKQTTIDQLKAELEKAKGLAKDEEEKRVKAISLLKTVRTKLVKAEKDKEDVMKERDDAKIERDAARSETAAIRADVERLRAEKERDVANLRVQYDRELAAMRDKFEKEAAARKGQFELEAITTKATHTKELGAKTTRISQLEATIRTLTQEKDSLFDQMQLRQAELESSQSHLETMTNQNSELQYQLREANDRIAVLSEEVFDARRLSANESPHPHLRTHDATAYPPSPSHDSPAELARLLSEAEGKYEARLSDLRSKIRILEKERNESEEEWAKNVAERGKEIERLKKVMGEREQEWKLKASAWEESETRIGVLENGVRELKIEKETVGEAVEKFRREVERLKEVEAALSEDKSEATTRMGALEKQIEELKTRETQLRANNKTLRDELRKVQSSAALLERQRNPGVGYWAATPSSSRLNTAPESHANGTTPSTPTRSVSPSTSDPNRPSTPTSPKPPNAEEEVNLEYLRNVILQFLENEKMREKQAEITPKAHASNLTQIITYPTLLLLLDLSLQRHTAPRRAGHLRLVLTRRIAAQEPLIHARRAPDIDGKREDRHRAGRADEFEGVEVLGEGEREPDDADCDAEGEAVAFAEALGLDGCVDV
ncbi:hypothetical protein FRB99_002657 [Tulasnella sp. 403]|nr:hypothetical protein FRB99_002657 [Tulasnella sp. 403]